MFWTVQFQDKGAEFIRTSDTTDVFYAAVINARGEREALRGEQVSLLSRIAQDQLDAWRACTMKECYQTQFNAYVRSVYLATGDITNAYKILVLPLNLIFMVGCYLLFLFLCRRRGLAALFAVLASFPIAIPLAGELFGIGPYTVFSRRHLFTAFVPLALYGFFLYRDNFRALILIFAFLGAIANLHASGILLIEITLLAYLLFHARVQPYVWHCGVLLLVALAAGFVALGSPWSVLAGFLEKFALILLPSVHAGGMDLLAGIDPALRYLFYPPHIYAHWPAILVHLTSIAVFVVALLPLMLRGRLTRNTYGKLLFLSSLAILAFLGFSEFRHWLLTAIVVWLFSWRKDSSPLLELAGVMILATYLVSFVLSVLLQFVHMLEPDFPAIHNSLRGVRFIGLLVFVWLIALMAQLDYPALSKSRRGALVVLIMLSVLSDLRHVVRDNLRNPANMENVSAMLDVARWARDHTPVGARFFVASSEFGIVSERNIYMTNKVRTSCAECVAATELTDAMVLLRAARANQMNYALLRKKDRAIRPDSVIYENRHYALLYVD